MQENEGKSAKFLHFVRKNEEKLENNGTEAQAYGGYERASSGALFETGYHVRALIERAAKAHDRIRTR